MSVPPGASTRRARLELATDPWWCARQTRLTVAPRIALALVESMVLRKRRDVHDL